jgi:hypothetical protein
MDGVGPPLKDSKKPILCGVIGPRLVRICQLSVSAGQLAELCVHTAGYLHGLAHGFGLETIKYRPGFLLKMIKLFCSSGTARILQVWIQPDRQERTIFLNQNIMIPFYA